MVGDFFSEAVQWPACFLGLIEKPLFKRGSERLIGLVAAGHRVRSLERG